MSKTTIAGILVAVGTIAGVVARYLSSGSVDGAGISAAIVGLLTAFGLYKAADGQ